MKPLPALLVAIIFTGCVPDEGTDAPDPANDACGAREMQALVGRPASVLETMRFAGEVRIIPPGSAVTMDFRPDRLNIEIDAASRIARVYCS